MVYENCMTCLADASMNERERAAGEKVARLRKRIEMQREVRGLRQVAAGEAVRREGDTVMRSLVGSVELAQDDPVVSVDRRRFPSVEDIRMVRVITLCAFLQAARTGLCRERFGPFCIQAKRIESLALGQECTWIHLRVRLHGTIVEELALPMPAFLPDGAD